ncbi:MAG: hypothetical protein JHC84_06475 [Solirubrobacteraceae bacterium]|nr:hypothetical protein [Solirubrobacteraceae bacterium]
MSLVDEFARVPKPRPGVGVYLGLAMVAAIAVWITGTADLQEAALAALLIAVPTTLGRLYGDHQRMARALPASANDVLAADDDEDERSGVVGAALLGVVIAGLLAATGALFGEGVWWGVGATVGIVIGSDLRALALRALVPRLHPDAILGHRLDGDGDDVYRLFALEPPTG